MTDDLTMLETIRLHGNRRNAPGVPWPYSWSRSQKTPTNQPARCTPMCPSNLSKSLSIPTEEKPVSDIEERIAKLERAMSRVLDREARRECYPKPDAEPSYRMAEPQNLGASVTSDGTVFTRTDSGDTPWRQHHDLVLAPLRWDWINNPEPYQNCVLTADDPEPPIGSVVRDDHCGSYERIDGGPLGWRSSRSGYHVGWIDITEATVTLLYRGEA